MPVGGSFNPITPVRKIDARDGTGTPQAQIGAFGSTTVQITSPPGTGPVPEGSSSVTANFTVVNATTEGFFGACTSDQTYASANVVFAGGAPIAGLGVTKLGADGKITLTNFSAAPIDVVVDLFGYTTATETTTGSSFVPISPVRQVDTRPPPAGTCTSNCGPIQPGPASTRSMSFFTGFNAISVTVTTINPTGDGWIALYQGGSGKTSSTANTSNLNFTAGQTIANSAIVQLSPTSTLDIVVGGAATDVVVDVNGWFNANRATWNYTYNAAGLRKTKQGPPGAVGFTGETKYTWSQSADLLVEQTISGWGPGKTYYIYGPGGLPVEQLRNDDRELGDLLPPRPTRLHTHPDQPRRRPGAGLQLRRLR